MARGLSVFPSAMIAVKTGMSASAWYRELRAEGIAPRRAEAFAIFRQAVAIYSRSANEPFMPDESVPAANEIGPWPAKKATGYRQNVWITYRHKVTGEYNSVPYSIYGDNLLSRGEAKQRAMAAYAEAAKGYNQDVAGVVYSSTQQYAPGW